MSGGVEVNPETMLPIAGAVVGAAAGIPAGPAGMAMGASQGAALGGTLGGVVGGGGSTNTAAQSLLGAQQTQAQTVAGPSGDNPFDAYGSASQAMPNVPSQQMNLTPGAQPPTKGFKEQVAGMPAQDKIGLAQYAVQAYGQAQAQAQARERADYEQAIAERNGRYINAPVVRGPEVGLAASNMGQFPTVGNGFSFGR